MATTRTVPKVAKLFGVAPKKVIDWIEAGELTALNLATRADQRPRYFIEDTALESFKRSREVLPKVKPNSRSKTVTVTKDYFSDI
ncbi:helix-turn-helix domain-containing protein [Bythopirellula polymerisocia]|uniref:Helix-turn-helix domain protein n=1 Tax=Bythopirellula polymerisocia TaxID=2528003 RepID=A0A5C6CNZ8_9BACT|nr:helix-turn-helix domain-containing protein [Bythopirellula polymerisocia]TWU24776.1 hypothetical protein Pla144_36620 [Bythopirellula polymerisocia]